MNAGSSAPGRRLAALIVAATLAFVTTAAQAAEIAVRNAWMRPAATGAGSARAYVDIESDVPVDLVGATTPFAMEVEIVRTGVIGDPSTESVVASYPVAARTEARLAYRGDHLRLVALVRDARNGQPVPLTLTFKDASGARIDVPATITVRGLLSQ